MEEIFKINCKTNESIEDWENTPINVKMESIGKMVAKICMEEQQFLRGQEYTFKINSIYDKSTMVNQGDVTIKWKLGEQHVK